MASDTRASRGSGPLAPTPRLAAQIPQDGFTAAPAQRAAVAPSAAPAPKPRRLAELPSLTTEHQGKARFELRPGTLVKGDFSAADVVQGQLNDCYMLAGFAAVAQSHPEALAKALTDNRDGTYTVKLYEPHPTTGRQRRVSVTVDGRLPMLKGKPLYGHSKDPEVLWVSVLEKAFAQRYGGYQGIEGGVSGEVVRALTGRPAQYERLGGTSAAEQEAVFRKLSEGLSAHKGLTVSIGQPDPHRFYNRAVHPNHTYTVVGVTEKWGSKKVQLRNPWGQGAGTTDGYFELSLTDFARQFHYYSVT